MNKKIIILLKFLCITYLIIFVQKILLYPQHSIIKKNKFKQQNLFTIGLESLTNKNKYTNLKALNYCLISDNSKTFNKVNQQDLDLLLTNSFKIKKIFVPIKNKQANILQKDIILNSANSKIPVYKLNILGNEFPQRYIRDIDGIIFDLNTIGINYDLAHQSLFKIIELAEKNNKKLIILDRPNILGDKIEGPGEIPFRTGLTLGELALYINKYYKKNSINLTIIPMENWKRSNPLQNVKANQISKKTPSINTCYGYSFLNVLNHVKPISIDINSPLAYQVFNLPEDKQLSEWETDYLKKISYKLGFFCKNYINKKTQKQGIRIRIKQDINQFSIFNSLLNLLRFLKNRKNINISFSKEFDQIFGTNSVRLYLQDQKTFEEVKNEINKNLNKFYTKAKSCFLYQPYPQIIKPELIRT
ncbi:DUF1343 domain-containing protein [Candidatus Dependentiae bacterium]|nr:DUF1343 domain-containing protein [Candidatus Dependentiae bacterium]